MCCVVSRLNVSFASWGHMLCTRPRTVVMQCCVRGCRSPSGKTWKTWSVFVFYVFYVVYVVYLLVYDLLDPCLVCSIFFQENADLDPHQKDVRHRSLVSWVLRKESKTPNRTQLHKLFKSFLEGADLCCPGQKGWLRGRGESLMNNMTSRRFFLLFCAGSIMPTFFSKSTTAQTEEKYQNRLIQIQHYSYLQLPPIRRFFHKPLTSLYNHVNHISLLNETSPIDPLPINTGDASRAAVLPRMLLACSVSVVAIANCFCCYCCNGQKSLNK